eukprot:1137219-Pleurochrysis_carterae.AAC.2
MVCAALPYAEALTIELQTRRLCAALLHANASNVSRQGGAIARRAATNKGVRISCEAGGGMVRRAAAHKSVHSYKAGLVQGYLRIKDSCVRCQRAQDENKHDGTLRLTDSAAEPLHQ